jgi:hypothetical protein
MTERTSAKVTVSTAPMVGQAVRRQVAVFDDYADAERVVDHLSDVGFPVQKVAIVGHELKYVEQVTGRLTYWGAAWRGALTGALPGALIGWIFGLFSWIEPLIGGLVLALYGLIFGAAIGAVFGIVVHAMQGGRRDFAAIPMVVPSRFELVVDEDAADGAARLIAQAPAVERPARTEVPSNGHSRTPPTTTSSPGDAAETPPRVVARTRRGEAAKPRAPDAASLGGRGIRGAPNST